MARYIDLSDAAKGRVQLAAARKIDWDAALADCAARAEVVKAAGGRPVLVKVRLENLRTEYRSILRGKRFAETGINWANVGLEG